MMWRAGKGLACTERRGFCLRKTRVWSTLNNNNKRKGAVAAGCLVTHLSSSGSRNVHLSEEPVFFSTQST